MADFNLAMALEADGSQAVSEVDRVTGSVKRLDNQQRGAAGGAEALADATGKTAQAQNQAGAATAAAVAQTQKLVVAQSNLAAAEARGKAAAIGLAEAQRKMTAATDADAAAQAKLAAAVAQAEARVAAASASIVRSQNAIARASAPLPNAFDESAKAANRQGYALRNVGQQFGDFGLQVAGGASIARAFGQQAGQLGFALSEMGGRAGKVGAFLVGPWGIALTVAAAALAPLVEKLFDSSKAADESREKLEKAAQAADSYGNAQSILGKVIDLTTGKLKTQNVVLIETIRLQARANLERARAAIAQANPASEKSFTDKARNFLQGDPNDPRRRFRDAGGVNSGDLLRNLRRQTDAQQKGVDAIIRTVATVAGNTALANTDPQKYARQVGAATQAAISGLDRLAIGGKVAGKSLTDVKLQILDIGRNGQDAAAALESLTALDGGKLSDDLRPYSRGKKPRIKKPKKPADTDGLVSRVNSDIASLTADFTDAPTFIERARAAVARLDKDIADLQKKKPPNFEALVQSAERAKGVIEANIGKPFDDFVKAQTDQLDILKLQNAGQMDQAEALRIIIGLEKQLGPLTPARKDAVLATVEALRAEQRQIDINRERVGLYVNALGDIKGVVQDATQAFVRGDLGQLIRSPQKLVKAFQNLQAERLFQNLFGGIFRDLQDQLQGTSVVEDASARMADAVDQVSRQSDRTADALGRVERAANGAAGATNAGGGTASSLAALGATPDLLANLRQYVADNPNNDITVTGRRPGRQLDPVKLFTDATGKIGEKVAGIFTNPESARSIGSSIGQFAGKGIAGAATGAAVGQFANPIIKALGLKTSKTGATVGGAIGGATGIPGGAEAGAILGSIVGGLFKKTKTGSATIGGVDGQAGVIGLTGNSSAYRKVADAAGGAVADSINNIVAQLGGQLGNFSVSIGQSKGKFRVDTSGRGRTTAGKSNDGVTGYDTLEEAQAAALRDAILDGAVAGISGAMQQALRSSEDVQRAVSEALKVKEVETLIAGIGGQLSNVFDQQTTQARERLRIARAYGLDVIAVEKANAEERAKLVAETLTNSVGSLQTLITDLNTGDLTEGTAADKRRALLAQISGVRTRADAGESGAADELASLYRNLYDTTRNGFGTAGGELSADRQLIQSGAAAVIKAQEDRINQAAGIAQATQKAAERSVDLANEANQLAAVANTRLDQIAALLAGGSIGSASGADYGLTSRVALV